MNEFEVDAVITVKAVDDEHAEGTVLEALQEAGSENIKAVEVLFIREANGS